MRKLIVFRLLCILLAIAGPMVIGCSAITGASTRPDHLTLTWTGNPATTMTITWRTDTTVTAGIVQYQVGVEPSLAVQEARAAMTGFTTDLGEAHLFSATLTGLAPDTIYTYRVGDGVQWGDPHTFTTADPQTRAFKFLVFGDSQSIAGGKAPYGLWRQTVHNAFKANPDAKFMVNLGDLVDTGQSGDHWNAWFDAVNGVIDTIPEMPVLGNHETYGKLGAPKPVYWITQFALPQNGPKGLKGQAYAYNYGPVHFVVLDSQRSEERKLGNIFPAQKAWLDADLAASKAPWKIAFFHKTPYDLRTGRENTDVRAAFSPILEQRHVDLVFNGHDHGVAHTFPIRGGVTGTKPSQGTIYYIAGRSGMKTYGNVRQNAWLSFFYNPQDQPNYLVVEVADTLLTVKAVRMDGTLIDAFSIDKANDAVLGSLTRPAMAAAALN